MNYKVPTLPEKKQTDVPCPYESEHHDDPFWARLALRADAEHLAKLFDKQKSSFRHLVLDLRRVIEDNSLRTLAEQSAELDEAFRLHAQAEAILTLVAERLED